eukprot:jgi/Chlat1/2075/Chrsp17S02772
MADTGNWTYFCNETLVAEGVACQEQVCLIPTPAEWTRNHLSLIFGLPVIFTMVAFFIIGVVSTIMIKGKAENFFVAGRRMNLLFVTMMLASSSLDSNATLGSVQYAYRYQYFDGAVIPIGLGLSLFLAFLSWSGLLIGAIYMLAKHPTHAAKSVGFPGFEACGTVTAAEIAALDPSQYDNGAFPNGDKTIYWNEMFNINALGPFPNAILFNWSTVITLAIGNLAALDFQARCFSAKSPRVARVACLISGFMSIAVGLPFAFLGGVARYYYGPDSHYAEFDADTSSVLLDLPSCAKWVPDDQALVKLMAKQAPTGLGIWVLCSIISASMSTADGAILATATVFAHNICRKLKFVKRSNLLSAARLLTIPFTFFAALAAVLNNDPGRLLIVAFDITTATCVPALFAAVYWKRATPNAAVVSISTGIVMRLTLQFTLPKDGSYVLPYGKYAQDYDHAYPGAPCDWDKSSFSAPDLNDWTGFDSLLTPLVTISILFLITYFESTTGRDTLFFIPKRLREPFFIDLVEEEKREEREKGGGGRDVEEGKEEKEKERELGAETDGSSQHPGYLAYINAGNKEGVDKQGLNKEEERLGGEQGVVGTKAPGAA